MTAIDVSMEEEMLSAGVRDTSVDACGAHPSYEAAIDWLSAVTNCSEFAAKHAVESIAAQKSGRAGCAGRHRGTDNRASIDGRHSRPYVTTSLAKC